MGSRPSESTPGGGGGTALSGTAFFDKGDLAALLFLGAAMVLGLLVRYAALTRGVIETPDSFAYLTLARDFLSFDLLTPDRWPGLHFPPLFPWVVRLTGRLGDDPMFAAALTNIGCSVLASIPAYFFCRRLLGRTAALAAATLPLFSFAAVSYQFQALSEGLFTFLLYLTLFLHIQLRRSLAGLFLVGALAGLLYLCRQAGAAVAGGLVLFEVAAALFGGRSGGAAWKRLLRGTAPVLLGFLFAAGPYLLHVRAELGRFALTSASNLTGQVRDVDVRKSPLEFERERLALNAGATDWARPENEPGPGILGSFFDDPGRFVRYSLKNARTIFGVYLYRATTGLPLAVLTLLGLLLGLACGETRRGAATALYWLLVSLSPYVLTIVEERYVTPSLPLLFFFTGLGIERIVRLAADLAGKALSGKKEEEGRGRREALLKWGARGAAAALLALSLVPVSRWSWSLRIGERQTPPDEILGKYIREKLPGPHKMATRWPGPAYYVGAEYQQLPYDTLPRTIEFLRRRKADLLYVSDAFILQYRPEWKRLLEPGYAASLGLEEAARITRLFWRGPNRIGRERVYLYWLTPPGKG